MEQEVSVYIRADKIKLVTNDQQTGTSGQEVSINKKDEGSLNGDVPSITAPKVFVEEADITESINVTLGPRKSSKVDQVNSRKNVKDDISNLASQHRDAPAVSRVRGEVISPELTPHKNDIQEDKEEKNENDVQEDKEDLVPEIRNKCNDVKEILNRIMNSDDNLEDDEEAKPDIEDKNSVNKSSVGHENDETGKVKLTEESPSTGTGRISNLFEKHDLFEDIDSIADLTIDQVKNLLEEEEKTNAKLKTDLYTQKDENIERTRKISQAKLSPDRKVQTKRKSKKEMQLEKIKDFLKDPSMGDDQEVNLDIRLKKTGGQLHFFAFDISSKQIMTFFQIKKKKGIRRALRKCQKACLLQTLKLSRKQLSITINTQFLPSAIFRGR